MDYHSDFVVNEPVGRMTPNKSELIDLAKLVN